MIARIATFHHLEPDELDLTAVQRLRGIIKSTPGFVAGFHVRNPDTGKALSIAVYESAEAVEQVREGLGKRADSERVGIEPDEVDFYTEVIEF